ncbi:ATP-binding protein [Sulfitobacter guttiformis]|uniref:histidine kinase n=2 Tax=Sulfitobacter guttiformis TaxID=74349 RepID=A0A420DU02_9RHOB|nr:ATP-binding protein [Sulfitobacter guttiformis]RKE97715.1 phospho-acceptor domain-containing protein [Sulfitobacter guttiformis]
MYWKTLRGTRIGGPWALLGICVALMIIMLAAYRLDRLLYASYLQEVRSTTYSELLEVRESFESVLHSQSLVLRELSTFIGENPDISQKEFSARVSSIRGVEDIVRSIAAAPDMIITLVHPLEGNRGALGLDYRTNSEQYPTVKRMFMTGKEMITGPVNLAQGGSGLILRAPVYLPKLEVSSDDIADEAEQQFWGVASLVLDYQKFLAKAGFTKAEERYDLFIDISGQSPDDEGTFVYGKQALLGDDTVKLQFDFEFENWVLHATTKGGWPETYPDRWMQRTIITAAALTLMLTFIYVLWLSEKRKQAEALLNRGVGALSDGFVMFDEHDRLIMSNEKYREIYGFPESLLKPGTHLRQFLNAGLELQSKSHGHARETDWMKHRLASFDSTVPAENEQYLLDGRVIKVSDHQLENGSYVGLRVDITELVQAKKAAEAANDAKTDFMGLLSHELRTPLTVILGVARIIQNARLMPASKKLLAVHDDEKASSAETLGLANEVFDQLSSMMDRLIKSGEHLLFLVNEMLDVAKVESGSMVVEPTQCAVADIVEPVIDQLRTLSHEKGLEFEVLQDAGTVFADVVRSRQILFNLIGNAIKFTEVGFVRLKIRSEEGMVIFIVQDSGPGIPEEDLKNIFEIFYQVDSTATRRAGGTGMGLAIAQSLANLQNGSLTVSSTVGVGSCFKLSLPEAI